MKLYGFANVEQHFVPYEYANINLVVTEVVIIDGNFCMTVINKLVIILENMQSTKISHLEINLLYGNYGGISLVLGSYS